MTRQLDERALALADVVALAAAALLAAVVPLLFDVGPLDTVIALVPVVILASFPLMRMLGASRLPFSTVELSGALFVVAAVVSATVVAPTLDSLLTILRYTAYVLLVVAVGAVARDDHSRRFLLWTFALAGGLTLVVALRQWIDPTSMKGIAGLDPEVATRVSGTFGNSNFYGEFLVMMVPVTFMLMLSERGLARAVSALLVVGSSAVLLLTYTRGSWIALAVGLVVALAMVDLRLVAPVMGAGVLAVAVVPGVLERILSIFSTEGTASFRMQLWRIAGEIIRQNPLFGVGSGNFLDAFSVVVNANPELNIGYQQYGAHNSLLTITAETGVFGGLAFAFLLFSIVRSGLYLGSRHELEHKLILQNAALTAALIAFSLNSLTSNSFQHPQAAVFFFFIAGLQAGLVLRVTASTAPVAPATTMLEMLDRSAVRAASAGVRRAWRASRCHTLLSSPRMTGAWRSSWAGRGLGRALGSHPSPPRRPGPTRQACRTSLLGRAASATHRVLADAWQTSVFRAAMVAPPPFSGRLVATSRFGRLVFGKGR